MSFNFVAHIKNVDHFLNQAVNVWNRKFRAEYRKRCFLKLYEIQLRGFICKFLRIFETSGECLSWSSAYSKICSLQPRTDTNWTFLPNFAKFQCTLSSSMSINFVPPSGHFREFLKLVVNVSLTMKKKTDILSSNMLKITGILKSHYLYPTKSDIRCLQAPERYKETLIHKANRYYFLSHTW